MKTKQHPATNPQETFASISIACFLILVAWGNAIGMLVFSLIGMAIWFMLPETPKGGESTTHHNVLVMVSAGTVAFVIAILLTLMNNGS